MSIIPTTASAAATLRRQINRNTDHDRLRRAFAQCHSEYVARHGSDPKPPELVFAVLEWSVAIERKQPDRDRSYLRVRSPRWPDAQPSLADVRAAAMIAAKRIASGDFDPAEALQRSQPSAADVSTAETVLKTFAGLMVGQHRLRDAKILHNLARGRSGAGIAKSLNLTRAAVADRKRLQCTVIGHALAHLMPNAKVAA